MSIKVEHITKNYGDFQALKDLSLDIPGGELVALLGPSGSGKTTLLRIIAGLEQPDSGRITFHGEDATSQSVGKRQVGFVFQHYALFRNMTVFENVAFGLRVKPRRERLLESEIRAKVHQLLKLVQMEWYADRYPSQLSGGQRQRIALARALAVEPKVLLLDEPFGALDAKVRKELRRWIRQLHDEIHITSIFVTHDQEEALEVADRVVVMNNGRIEQIGTPEEVYEHPANLFVYQFLGDINLFQGRVDGNRIKVGNSEVAFPELAGMAIPDDKTAIAYARPHELEVYGESHGENAIEAEVRHVRVIGPTVRLELRRRDNGGYLDAELSKERFHELKVRVGERVFVELRNLKIFVEDYQI
ncbi:MAG TPA: sulfate ABC transporter ATP-binding protein [Bacillota bacterium]|nr:sulfate ABC transporter ATP-binding protein [Bacillota bacterium]